MWIGKKIIERIEKEKTDTIDAAYIYDLQIFRDNCKKVKNAFSEFNILYSMKANPHHAILRESLKMNLGIDAASRNEVKLAADNGFTKDQIYFSAPGKTEYDLLSSIDKCTIIADSLNEVKRLVDIAYKMNQRINIGIRLNISNTSIIGNAFEIMSGIPTKFGIELNEVVELKEICANSLVDIIGMHIYFGSQILEENIIKNNFLTIIKCTYQLRHYFPIRFVNFGGGFGVPQNEHEKALDLRKIADKELLKEINKLLCHGIKCNLELGRYLISDAGIYVSKVEDIKLVGNIKYIVLSSGMNGFFRPIFTKEYHKMEKCLSKTSIKERVTIVGNLCTPIDEYYSEYLIERLEIGDWIYFRNAGAYGYSMSLLDFISHDRPLEIVI